MSRLASVVALAAALAVSSVSADTLSVNGTADDFFKLYISTDLNNPGAVLFDKNSGWGALGSTTLNLQPGQSVYLLIDAENTGGPAMFMADFTLSGGDLRFANGLTTLTTDLTHWTVSPTSFATATAAPVSMGQNLPGLQIWGQRGGISTDAVAIWAYNADWSQGQAGHNYFVAQITAPVPEPTTAVMFLAGAGLLTAVRRRAR
jgi:hypothetical protein